jgi:hypothetical protein
LQARVASKQRLAIRVSRDASHFGISHGGKFDEMVDVGRN